MGVLGKIFGSDKIVDTVSNGIDKSFFTPQERAKHFLDLLKSYEPFKLAQRVLAFLVVFTFAFTWLLSVGMFVVAGFTDNLQLAEAASKLGSLNNETLGFPTALVLGFYFGGGALEGVVDRFNKKK